MTAGRRVGLALVILAAIGLLVWAPWLTPAGAAARTEQAFESAWEGVIDGCGFNCTGCGPISARRLLIGYAVEIEFACGLIPEDTPEYHLTERLYVSPLGTVHGINRP